MAAVQSRMDRGLDFSPSIKRMRLTGPMPLRNCSNDEPMKDCSSPFKVKRPFRSIDTNDSKSALSKTKTRNPFLNREALDGRQRTKVVLEKFHCLLPKFVNELSGKFEKRSNATIWTATCAAAKRLLEQESWARVPKQIGHIAGLEIGDKFQHRAELKVVGLHHQFFQGIDYITKDGEHLATSIVASGRYENDVTAPDRLIYTGQGGNPSIGCKQLVDQKIERGNRALINSKKAGTPVRVVYGFSLSKLSDQFGVSGKKLCNKMYVYDGLYFVDSFCQERGKFGKLVFKFSLRRISDQPKLSYENFARKRGSEKGSESEAVVWLNDISQGKEKVPIRFKKALHEEKLPCFDYITTVIYQKLPYARMPLGCSCESECRETEICACATRNGGSVPYDLKGRILARKPVIYECSPGCKCPLSCVNRVSQHGISFQMEVFWGKLKRLGVRSRAYIPKGSFVCEYIGEVLCDSEVEKRINGCYRNRFLRGGAVHVLSCSNAGGFTVDATLRGNVGRFVNHCDFPNLRAQYVLYDHTDVKMPHVMLFAIKDIPPNHELTIDYSLTIAKFGMRVVKS